jgi:hypothetical protein
VQRKRKPILHAESSGSEDDVTSIAQNVASELETPAPAINPPLPSIPNVVTPEAVCAWIEQVTPLMDERSKYRKRLMSAVQRHRFREQRQLQRRSSDVNNANN